jgi:hypothetical protein
MSKIYLTQAHFSDFGGYWSILIGIFTEIELAEKFKNKWDKFFKEKQSLFNKPDDWKPSEKDQEYDIVEWEESEGYMILSIEYGEIKKFESIEIEEYELNKDLFREHKHRKTIEDLLLQWDRDYKINDII